MAYTKRSPHDVEKSDVKVAENRKGEPHRYSSLDIGAPDQGGSEPINFDAVAPDRMEPDTYEDGNAMELTLGGS